MYITIELYYAILCYGYLNTTKNPALQYVAIAISQSYSYIAMYVATKGGSYCQLATSYHVTLFSKNQLPNYFKGDNLC